MNIYLFDVDGTLWCSSGPVTLDQLVTLRSAGHAVGLCGNWALALRSVNGWPGFFSFIGPLGGQTKQSMMADIKAYVPADRYVFVGNVGADDMPAAQAGWEFVKEDQFR